MPTVICVLTLHIIGMQRQRREKELEQQQREQEEVKVLRQHMTFKVGLLSLAGRCHALHSALAQGLRPT